MNNQGKYGIPDLYKISHENEISTEPHVPPLNPPLKLIFRRKRKEYFFLFLFEVSFS